MLLVIDKEFWDKVQFQFPEKVHARLKGLPLNDDEEIEDAPVFHQICEKGKIKEDLENQREELRLQDEVRRFVNRPKKYVVH